MKKKMVEGNFKILFHHSPPEPRKHSKTSSQDNKVLVQELNSERPEYEVEVLTTVNCEFSTAAV